MFSPEAYLFPPQSHSFETIGGDEIESRAFFLGEEPALECGDIVSVRYSDYDLSLMFIATSNEIKEDLSDEDVAKYAETATPETNNTTRHATTGNFYIADEKGVRLVNDGIWYAREKRTTFFDLEYGNLELNGGRTVDSFFFKINFLNPDVDLDMMTYEKIRKSDRVDYIVHSRKVNCTA